MANTDDWGDVEVHIERHESGCWTWDGALLAWNVYRYVAEAYGAPFPAGQKLYRMPDCKLGAECVNPNHIGTVEDFVLSLQGRRHEIPEPPKMATGAKLTPRDKQFLKTLRIRWE